MANRLFSILPNLLLGLFSLGTLLILTLNTTQPAEVLGSCLYAVILFLPSAILLNAYPANRRK